MTWLLQYSDGCVQFLPTYSDDAVDVSHSTSILLEESLSMDLDVLYTSSAEHSESQSCTPVPEMTIAPIPLPMKSQLRKSSRTISTKAPAASARRKGALKHGRPVIFATKRPVGTKTDDVAFDSHTSTLYTIEELVSESKTAGLAVTPCVRL